MDSHVKPVLRVAVAGGSLGGCAPALRCMALAVMWMCSNERPVLYRAVVPASSSNGIVTS
jgi:hypothetical protein